MSGAFRHHTILPWEYLCFSALSLSFFQGSIFIPPRDVLFLLFWSLCHNLLFVWWYCGLNSGPQTCQASAFYHFFRQCLLLLPRLASDLQPSTPTSQVKQLYYKCMILSNIVVNSNFVKGLTQSDTDLKYLTHLKIQVI